MIFFAISESGFRNAGISTLHTSAARADEGRQALQMVNAVANMQAETGRVPDTWAKFAAFIVPDPNSFSFVVPINLYAVRNNPHVGAAGSCKLCLPSKAYAMINPGCCLV